MKKEIVKDKRIQKQVFKERKKEIKHTTTNKYSKRKRKKNGKRERFLPSKELVHCYANLFGH